MNNSFDIHRFVKLVRHDVRRCSPRSSTLGASLIGMLWFVPMMVLTGGLIGQAYGAGYRVMMAGSISLLLSAMIPIQLYANVGRKHKRGDIYFAMLPASKLEKYLSIALLSMVLVPLAMLTVNVVIDTLLTAVHMPFYHKYMWQASIGQWVCSPMLCSSVVAFVGSTLGFIYANAVQNKAWRYMLCFLLCIWIMAGFYGGILVFIEVENRAILWGIVIAQVLLAILMGFLGWNKMNKISY